MAVTAYAQDLGTLLLKPGVGLAEGGDLVGSTACEVKDVEGEDYALLSPELTEGYLLAVLVQKVELGSGPSNFRRHWNTSW